MVECHPQSVGPPSCKEHRRDQNLHFQFLSSIASILVLRWIVVGSNHSLVAHHLLWKTSGFYPILLRPRRVVYNVHLVITTLSVLEPLVFVELSTMLANVRDQMPLTSPNWQSTLWLQLRQLCPGESSLSTNILPTSCLVENLVESHVVPPVVSAAKSPPHGQGSDTQML